jgi:hypothetical protein
MGDTMIVLYTVFVFVLSGALFLARRQANALERRYSRLAVQANEIVGKPLPKQGNTNQADPYQNAKRQFELGLLVQKRDRAEARYTAWQGIADRFAGWVKTVKGWKGRKLPYTFGVLDITGLLVLIDMFGGSEYLNARALIQMVTTLFKG